MKKALFLDIDGVLCFRNHYLEEDKLELLAEIQRATSVRIVLISVWRKFDKDRKILQREFKKYKIIWNKEDRTSDFSRIYLNENERPYEIQTFLNEHSEIKRFAILDDENHTRFGENMFHANNHQLAPGKIVFLKKISESGLTKALATRIIAFLNKTVS